VVAQQTGASAFGTAIQEFVSVPLTPNPRYLKRLLPTLQEHTCESCQVWSVVNVIGIIYFKLFNYSFLMVILFWGFLYHMAVGCATAVFEVVHSSGTLAAQLTDMCINRKTGSAYRRRLIPGGGQ
jgi:hypothetical protein